MATNEMKKMEECKKLHQKKLKKISEMLQGKQKLENCSKVEDVLADSRNSKTLLATIAKDLYAFCKEILDATYSNTTVTTNQPEMANLGQVVREQLEKILPGAISEAMKSLQIPEQKTEETGIAPEPVVKKHTLVVEHKMTDTEGEEKPITEEGWKKVTRKKVTGALKNVPVEKAIVKDGKASLSFTDKESLDKAASALEKDYKVSAETKDKRKLSPKMIITGIDAEITSASDLEKEIFEKNKELNDLKDAGENLKVIFYNTDDKTAVVEVSPAMRSSIKKKHDKLHLGLGQRNVRDHVHVIQCYHCQEHGHKSGSQYCRLKGKDPICFYCAARHPSKQCSKKNDKKKQQCSNCLKSNTGYIKERAKTHNATDKLCPYVIRETEIVMSRTAGYKEAKNEYIQRIQRQRTMRR